MANVFSWFFLLKFVFAFLFRNERIVREEDMLDEIALSEQNRREPLKRSMGQLSYCSRAILSDNGRPAESTRSWGIKKRCRNGVVIE